MNKKLIWVLTGMVTVVLIGLILVQTYWIRNAIKVQEKQFNQLVNRTLLTVVGQLEREEAFREILNELWNSSDSTGMQSTRQYFYDPDQIQKHGDTLRKSPDGNSGTIVYDQSENGRNYSGYKIFRDTSFILKDTLQRSILHFRYSEQQYITKGIDSQHSGSVRRPYSSVIEDIMNRMLRNKKDIRDRVNPAMLSRVISGQLTDRGIDIPFQFAVLGKNNQVVYNSDNFNKNSSSTKYTCQLFPDDFLADPSYLTIYFPSERNFLFKSMGFMAITSIVLTLIVIFSSSLTLFIIFRQKRLSEMKNDFINNMTHELKTPISTISLASQMLNDPGIPVEMKNVSHIGKIIEEESKRLGYQVEKVLQTAIFNRGRLKLKLKPVNVDQLIEKAVDNFKIQLNNRGGRLELDTNAGETTIQADEMHITNVIVNLLDNALKYSGDNPEVKITSKTTSRGVKVYVKDNGIGISKENQKRIFERFYRVSTGNIHNVKGFGLGLSYVKKIIDAHEGKISINSELNKGSTFSFFIPFNRKEKITEDNNE